MKTGRFPIYLLCLLAGVLIGAGLYMLLDRGEDAPPPSASVMISGVPGSIASNAATPEAAALSDMELLALAYRAAGYIKERDYRSLSGMVHPEFGVVFSPYSTVNLSSNQCFSPGEVSRFASDEASYLWGVYDGSGKPIELSPAAYFDSFVFDRDYTDAPVLGIDCIVRSGNSLENVAETFPNARFVDLHYPCGETGDDGMSWSTLRLVFEQSGGAWMLTAVIHSQWTI